MFALDVPNSPSKLARNSMNALCHIAQVKEGQRRDGGVETDGSSSVALCGRTCNKVRCSACMIALEAAIHLCSADLLRELFSCNARSGLLRAIMLSRESTKRTVW